MRLVYFIPLLLIASARDVHPDYDDVDPLDIDKEYLEKARDAASHAAERAKETLSDATDKAKGKLSDVKDKAKETFSDVKDTLEDQWEKAKDWMGSKKSPSVYERMMAEVDSAMAPLKHLIKERNADTDWHLIDQYPDTECRSYPTEDILYIDVPGIPMNELSVKLAGNLLSIHGDHATCIKSSTSAKKPLDKLCVHREYNKKIRIASDIDRDHITTYHKDGILIVHLPKVAALEKDIPVHVYELGLKDKIKEKLGM